MRKFIGTIVIVAIIIVGFTGLKLNVNGYKMNVPPYISNIFKDKKVEISPEEVKKDVVDMSNKILNKNE